MKYSSRNAGTRSNIGLLLWVILFAVMSEAPAPAQTNVAEAPDELWNSELANINRIAQFTAKRRASLLFTIFGERFGYASAGMVRKLPIRKSCSLCPYPNPALSHDGRFVAFLAGSTPHHAHIAVLTLATGLVRTILDLDTDPRELSWSWSDGEIAFPDSRLSGPLSIKAVSVLDGSVRTLVPPSQFSIVDSAHAGHFLGLHGGAPIQWIHSNDKVVAGFDRDVPSGRPNEGNVEWEIDVASRYGLLKFDEGAYPVVSPVADRVAWCKESEILAKNLDGSDYQVLVRSPRWLGLFSESLGSRLTWSPDGRQMFFGVLVSETCRDDVYLLNVDSRVYKRFLHKTCITIEDWR